MDQLIAELEAAYPETDVKRLVERAYQRSHSNAIEHFPSYVKSAIASAARAGQDPKPGFGGAPEAALDAGASRAEQEQRLREIGERWGQFWHWFNLASLEARALNAKPTEHADHIAAAMSDHTLTATEQRQVAYWCGIWRGMGESWQRP